MKHLYLLIIFIIAFTTGLRAKNNIYATPLFANAGPDQTIYLTQTSTVVLNGSSSSSGTSYLWTEISTDYKSTATITSPTSAITLVTGLEQGTWYYQLKVTKLGITAKDTVVIKVDYDVPPILGTLARWLDIKALAPTVNLRDDTLTYFPLSNFVHSQVRSNPNDYYLYRDRVNGILIDSLRAKFYTTIEDGYASAGNNYARSENQIAEYNLDSNKTYCFEWKGYFLQAFPYMSGTQNALAIFQIHPASGGTVFQYSINANGQLFAMDNINGLWTNAQYTPITLLSNMVLHTHTIRTTVREGKGYIGQDAFIKVEFDGIQKYFRDTGVVGGTMQQDYQKFAGLYDYDRAIVNPDSLTRGRKASLVTEEFRIYELDKRLPPVAHAGTDQTITLPVDTITLAGIATNANGTVDSYFWTKISGPSIATMSDANNLTTLVTGLVEGVYKFELKVTDGQGTIAKDTVIITVNAANLPPVALPGGDQTITLPTNSVNFSGSGTDADGKITSYVWTKISGPTEGTITYANTAATSVTGLVKGFYTFELTVTDNQGATAKATVNVRVNALSTLPVTTLGFSGKVVGNTNILNWSSATEQNTEGFDVQRSSDGNNFIKLAFEATKALSGNSSIELLYDFIDKNHTKGINYYRLKQINKEGNYIYSSIVELKNNFDLVSSSITLYPNPVKSVLNVKLQPSTHEKIRYSIIDINGKTIIKDVATRGIEEITIPINVSNLSAGTYFLETISNNVSEISINKFQKQ